MLRWRGRAGLPEDIVGRRRRGSTPTAGSNGGGVVHADAEACEEMAAEIGADGRRGGPREPERDAAGVATAHA